MTMNRGVAVPPSHQQQNLDDADNNNNNNKKRPVDQFYAPPTDQFQQHQYSRLGIDDIIFQQRMRREIEERQNLEARLLASSIGQIAMNALKEKDEHIQRICNLTSALEEKAKSLLTKNQVWRELAHANEAKANTLRANLNHLLLLRRRVDADAESSCGSNNISNSTNHHHRRCKMCREKEACVLVLPCRHLCLCGGCGGGSQLRECPVCNAAVKATLHVNMSMP